MHRILFATDFSSLDRGAFEQACLLAGVWKANLLIAHVEGSGFKSARDHMELTRELHHITPNDLSINYNHILRTGSPTEVILDIESEFDVDLIVLGTHGRRGLKRMFNGSVAESVIRSAQCPVMTLRQKDEKRQEPARNRRSNSRILVPIDFSAHSHAVLDFASSMAVAIEATITILHVDDDSDDATNLVREGITEWSNDRSQRWAQLSKIQPREKGIEFAHKMINSPAPENITQYANEKLYDYIVLGTHGRSGVGRTLMGSVAEQVIRNANCPVITVKPSNKRNPDLHYSKLAQQRPV